MITTPAKLSAAPHDALPQSIDVSWLVRLRWIALSAQLVTLFALWAVGATGLQMTPLLAVEAAIFLSNLALHRLRHRRKMARPQAIASILALDALFLTALLAFSGGPMNPYTIFYLVQIIMTAVILGGHWTWAMAAFCSVAYSSLFFLAPVSPHQLHGAGFASHLYGMLASFICAAACTTYFVLLVQRQRFRAQEDAARAQFAATRAESFASLTAVAAGAAHELATPLATIAVAARELERAAAKLDGADSLADDARLIREEVDRCRLILDALSPPYPGGDSPASFTPRELIDSVLARLGEASRVRVEVDASAPIRLPRHRTTQAAAALLQNALDAGAAQVSVACNADPEGLLFRVSDNGPGMSPAVQSRLGEPFFTTRPQGRGLGLFLVRQFVEQVGGRLHIDSAPGQGTRVTMVLPPQREAL